jgi:hypothetical protein
MQLTFNKQSNLDPQELYNLIESFLKANPVVLVKFLKVSGEFRVMICSRNPDYVPQKEYSELISKINSDINTMLVWSLDQNSWRQFKTNRVLSIESVDSRQISPREWVLDVSQDPDTGDLMLQFPQNVLDQAGWKTGDVLKWTENPDGSLLLSKV